MMSIRSITLKREKEGFGKGIHANNNRRIIMRRKEDEEKGTENIIIPYFKCVLPPHILSCSNKKAIYEH
jgi:hypothetical protein